MIKRKIFQNSEEGDLRKKRTQIFLFIVATIFVIFLSSTPADVKNHKTPPFQLNGLKEVQTGGTLDIKGGKLYNPKNPYNIFINYELGMHCVGFDISYCCIIPPYNSIQTQAVKSGENGQLPILLSPSDNVKLYYYVKDNSYSEGNKMKYWQVLKDVDGNGTMSDPNDNIANYVWSHLFIYKDLAGSLPENWQKEKRLHIGKEIAVPIDAGPSGKPLVGGYLDYAGENGGNIVFTDSLIPEVKNISLKLTSSYIWDALGLPLTAFNDSKRKGSRRTITNKDFQPYQYSMVQLHDGEGKPIAADGKVVEFFGTNPVDFPGCYTCHSGKGVAAELARNQGLRILDEEYNYWKTTYPDISEYMARVSQASICVLELHDKSYGTNFLRDYRADASTNRLGEVGVVNCADCHGDNISGNLQTPRPIVTGYKGTKAKTLTESIHSVHAQFIPMPDKAGRTQSCQACHPAHWQVEEKNDLATNPFHVIDENGNPRFSESDLRMAGGGCYLRRDATTNPHIKPPFFLNEIGKWYFENVSTRDENGNKITELRGFTCTNCHNKLTQVLNNYDELKNVIIQDGKTLRNKSLKEIIKVVANDDLKKFMNFFADPKVSSEDNPLYSFYANHQGATLVKATKDEKGNLKLLPWNAKEGNAVPYEAASGGSDWWLSAAEPHCANCHFAPFVESEGGRYFPIDQPTKYSLFRYSKAHGVLACQSCHESMHGLYPVRYEGEKDTVDLTTHQQALQFSPDGEYAGPVTCAACHTVNEKGVPVQLKDTEYYTNYWAAVVLVHFMRTGDQELPIKELMKKFPIKKSQEIVLKGWN
jgi:mono/diheme cytochrome c family protein